MNPLVSTRCAARVLMALASIAGIFLGAGCGSGGGIARPNPVGFGTGSLSGTYVFSSEGEDAQFGFIAVAGALVANGSGGITGGTMDIVDSSFSLAAPVAQTITSGSYSVSADGRGRASLTSSVGTVTLDFVLASTSHGLVTEFDGHGTGSGTIDLQTSVPSLSQLAGQYAFSLGGIDANFNGFATVGAFALDASGTITTGVQDFNDGGIPNTDNPLTGAATVGSGTAPGTITLTANFGALTFDFYPIDATHLKFIQTDFSTILLGDAFSQTGASIPAGTLVFTMTGGTTGPIAVGGLMTSDGTGTFTGGLEDVNNNGVVSGAQVAFFGQPSIGPFAFGGRVTVNLTGFVPATTWVIYPSTGGLLMLEADSANVTLGAAYAQTSKTLAASQNYGLNLSAFNTSLGVEEDDIAQFTTTSIGLSGVVDINDDAVLSSRQALNGNYTLDSPVTGRGQATTTANNSSFVSFTFYVVNSSTVLLLETDTNQIGAGLFQLQNTPGAAPVTQSRMSIMRPGVGLHGALRRK